MGWRKDRNGTENGLSSPAIETPFKWRFDSGPPLNAGLVAL